MRVMVTFGKIEEFNSANEDWPQYEEGPSHYFIANGIDSAEKKHTALLRVIGATTCKLLCSLMVPSKPSEKSYEELMSAQSAHFNPAPLPIMCRFKFHYCCHCPDESIAMFMSQLRTLSDNYCFNNLLEEDMLHNCTVCGVNNNAIQKWLLAELVLKF